MWADFAERYDAPLTAAIWALSLASWVVVPCAIVWVRS